MGKRSTVKGYWRQRGSGAESKATPAPVLSHLAVTFDGAAANTTLTGKWLPAGAIILSVDVASSHTGGTTPAFDIGVNTATPDPDGILNGAVSTTTGRYVIGDAQAGVLVGAALAADAEITAGDDGTGTAGTGNITAIITFGFNDDGVVND